MENSPVPESKGHMLLTRILYWPNSAARPLVTYFAVNQGFLHAERTSETGLRGNRVGLTFETAPLEALYQTNPGRGRAAPTEEILIIEPPWPCSIHFGIAACTLWKAPRTLMSKTRSHSASVTSRVGCHR
jgi:hypothetical protein